METPFFSVVIPTYNRKELLAKCLEALRVQSINPMLFEVIVVDDGSTDGTQTMLRQEKFPFEFRAIAVSNGGASAARNAGVGIAAGTFVAFTEDDVIPDVYWLAAAHARLLSGRIDMLEGETVTLGSGRGVRRFEVGGIPSFIPCNLFVRRSVFEKVGGYDPTFYDGKEHLYFREDADFGFRILDAGFVHGFAPDAIVSHPAQFGTLGECFRHARRYRFDPLLYKKHPARFRHMIEVKRVLGLTIHRPLHLVSLLYTLMLVESIACFALGFHFGGWGSLLVAFLCSMIYRFRSQGKWAFNLFRAVETVGFFFLPLVYLWSLVRGCIRYRTAGPLL